MKYAVLACACVAATAPVVALEHVGARQDFSAAASAARALPQMHSLLVSHRGRLALEYYARGYSATRLANIKSASKSVISTLVGIAIARGLIAGIDEPIVRWFPELRKAQAGDYARNAHPVGGQPLATSRFLSIASHGQRVRTH